MSRTVNRLVRLGDSLRSRDVAVFHDFAPPPAGGGHQFLRALVGELRSRGLRLETNRLSRTTSACLFNSFNFDRDRLAAVRRSGCRMVHRVDGPIGVYRGFDDGTDAVIGAANRAFADVTVFQSAYSRDAHLALGIDLVDPVVIPNAVDPAIFHACGRVAYEPARRLRLIATSWSDNPNKGGATLAWIDRHLDWSRYEMTFVGRTRLSFDNIVTVPPVASAELAQLLREHDIYVTASRHESCSNALLEALACGLPALHVDSGSNGELVQEAGLAFTVDDEIPALLQRLADEYEARQARIVTRSLSEVGDLYLAALGLGGQI